MAPPTLRGQRIVLREPQPGDVGDRIAIGRDPEFRRLVGAKPSTAPMTRADAERWYTTLAREPYGWVIAHGGRCVGEARLHHVDAAAGVGWLALGLFAPESRGRGLGTQAVQLMLGYAFGALGLSRVRLRVLAFNARALACYVHCGFGEIAREPVTLDGETAEDIVMELTASAFDVATQDGD